jgi:hypothetical protein
MVVARISGRVARSAQRGAGAASAAGAAAALIICGAILPIGRALLASAFTANTSEGAAIGTRAADFARAKTDPRCLDAHLIRGITCAGATLAITGAAPCNIVTGHGIHHTDPTPVDTVTSGAIAAGVRGAIGRS